MSGYAERLLSGSQGQDGEMQPVGGYADRLLGGVPAMQAVQQKKPSGGNIFSNAWEMIKGKRDPNYADVPAFDIDRAGPGVIMSTAGATLANADDTAYADIIQKSLGDRFLGRTKDANGYEIIDYIDASGTKRRGYVNMPGLDMGDVQRAIGGGLAYMGVGKVLGRAMQGAPMLGRVAAQGGGAASTSVVQDIGSMALGSEQGIDPKKAVIAGAGGALFEGLPSKAVAPLLGGAAGAALSNEGDGVAGAGLGAAAGMGAAALARRLLGMNPGQYVQNGKLTPAGEKAAASAGVNPAEVNDEFAKVFADAYAKTRSASLAAVEADARSAPVPVRLTKGQRERDYQQMVLEDQMRAGLKGPQAKSVMDDFDRLQTQDIAFAADRNPMTLGGVSSTLAPRRLDTPPMTALGSDIRAGVQTAREGGRQAEKQAWEGANKGFAAPEEALAMLPGEIRDGIAKTNIPVNQNTPTASKMVDFLRDYRAGKAPTGADDFLPDMTNQSVDQVRRVLGRMKDDAATATDKAAADAVYRSYNTWMGKAADAGHFPAEAVAAIRSGRSISAEVKGLFEPRDGGRLTPAAQRIRDVLERADSPEAVVATLFGRVGAKGMMPAGTTGMLSNLKTALQKYAPETGKQTWDDIRLAYWRRITTDSAGNLLSPQMLAKNIATAKNQHGEAWNILLNPREQAMIMQVQKAVEAAGYRPSNFRTNSSGSAFAGGSMIKDLVATVWKALAASPAVSATAGAVMRPVASGWYKGKAQRATDPRIQEVVPSLGGYGGAVGSAIERNRAQ